MAMLSFARFPPPLNRLRKKNAAASSHTLIHYFKLCSISLIILALLMDQLALNFLERIFFVSFCTIMPMVLFCLFGNGQYYILNQFELSMECTCKVISVLGDEIYESVELGECLFLE